MKSNQSSNNIGSTVKNTAMTERSVRKVWESCMLAEEANRMLKKLVAEKVWTNSVEAFSHARVWPGGRTGGRRGGG